MFCSDSDEDNEVFEEAIEQPLTTEGTFELAKNWTLRYSHPHTTIGQSDTGSNEYEDSSDDYISEGIRKMFLVLFSHYILAHITILYDF